jgi:hypothetical protein
MNTRRILHGAYGGLAGGLIFGAMMAKMGTLPMIGKMIGQPSAAAGFLLHMVNSAVIGAGFAIVVNLIKANHSAWVRSRTAALVHGLAYGGLWWVLGPLTLMPLFLGMGLGVNWNLTAAGAMLPSLVGHLVYGAVLGLTYGTLQSRVAVTRAAVSLKASAAGGK